MPKKDMVEAVLYALIDPWISWRQKRGDLKKVLQAAERMRRSIYADHQDKGFQKQVRAARAYDAALKNYE